MAVCSRSARSQDRVLISGDALVTVKINSLTGGGTRALHHADPPVPQPAHLSRREGVTRADNECRETVKKDRPGQ
jgi:hypothetical protein